MRRHELTPQAVDAAVEALLEGIADGPRATVSALARRLSVARQTLYRDFPDQITRLQTEAARPETQPRARNTDKDQQIIARLRAEKENLTRHLHIYEDHIRRLALENEALRVALQAHSGVTLISPRLETPPPADPDP
ncbi:hypothetical protein [Streptomyces sp. NPDC006335]|uniref:hypothetical protein n=1 Tax=Streptomyces sp. NPDC006335 TaxID=3156895 RepID=UPI0033A1FDC0